MRETKTEYKQRVEKARKETFREKRFCMGPFEREVGEVADERSWQWLRAGHLGKSTEGYVFAAQEQALRTRVQFRVMMEKEDVDLRCQ